MYCILLYYHSVDLQAGINASTFKIIKLKHSCIDDLESSWLQLKMFKMYFENVFLYFENVFSKIVFAFSNNIQTDSKKKCGFNSPL